MVNRPYIFLDIDGVLATVPQFYSKKRHEEWNCYSFDKKCVNVFNDILEATDARIILSSDWKTHYDLDTMNNIFEWNKIVTPLEGFTDDLWGTAEFRSLDQLEEVRASEILKYVKDHDVDDYHWVAIDDLDLSPYLHDSNFVNTPRVMEGIKQSGKKLKILKRLL
jgi:hypothetical protein